MSARIKVKSDHKSLQFLFTCQHLSGKLYRWAVAIMDFARQIEFIKGKENIVADCLSRMRYSVVNRGTKALKAAAILKEPNVTMSKLIKNFHRAQRADEGLRNICERLERSEKYPGYDLNGDLLSKTFGDLDLKVVVSKTLIIDLVRCTHEVYCHPGGKKMIKLLSPNFSYPGLKKYSKLCSWM